MATDIHEIEDLLVVGVDMWRKGWVSVFGVDIPIGLPDIPPREADVQARSLWVSADRPRCPVP